MNRSGRLPGCVHGRTLMNNTRDFVNRFRYAILAVLVVLTIGYGYYLYRLYMPAEQPAQAPTVNVAVMVDGSVRIDGAQYDTPEKLKPKVAELQKEHPDISFTINAGYGAQMEPISKAVVLLRLSGAKTVWVVNDTKKAPTP